MIVDQKQLAAGGKSDWPCILAILYLLLAGATAYWTIEHTRAMAGHFDQICEKEGIQNQGAQFVARLNAQHPIIGPFVSRSLKQALELPSLRESSHELGFEIPRLAQLARREGAIAAWWSWFLLSASLIYIVSAIAAHNRFRSRSVLFALTGVATVFFVVGMAAPAMVILTMPVVPIATGKLSFVLQHEIRSIFSVIAGLFSSGHWIIGGLITLFSIVTPLTKTSLTLIAATTASSSIHARIARFLHAIGKWSMADVFVAAVLLACFALNTQEATKAIPCLGLYYFAGYCLLSMVTTWLLTNLNFVSECASPHIGKQRGTAVRAALLGAAFLLVCVGGIYTFEMYPVPAVPIELMDVQVSLPAHRWKKIPISVPRPGSLSIELSVTRGNPVDLALISADKLSNVEQANGVIHAENLRRASLPAFKAVQTKDYNGAGEIDKGDFFVVLHDTTLGILSASKSDIEIHASLKVK